MDNRELRIMASIFIAIVIILQLSFFLFTYFYEDNNKPNDSDFTDDMLTKTIDVTLRDNVVSDFTKFVKEYTDILYLQWIRVDVLIEKADITNELLTCVYNTYDSKSKQYGEIHAKLDLITGQAKSVSGHYGYEKEEILLADIDDLKERVQDIERYMNKASKKMKKVNGTKQRYRYYLILEKDKTTLYDEESGGRYHLK